jgi:hypothetical protein
MGSPTAMASATTIAIAAGSEARRVFASSPSASLNGPSVRPSAHPFLPYLREVKGARRGGPGLIQELVQKLPRVDRIDALVATRRIARKRVHVRSIAQNVAVEEHRTAGVAEA